MLWLHLRVGKSLLAHGLFELTFVRFITPHRMLMRLDVISRSRFTVVDQTGTRPGGVISMLEFSEFEVEQAGLIEIQGVALRVHRGGTNRVKVGIDAPRSVRITRPSVHGTSLV